MRDKLDLWRWEHAGRSQGVNPPHIVKKKLVKAHQNAFKLDVLIESGTYYGDMVAAVRGDFQQIYSIELSESLANRARKRFRRDGHIRIIRGDSARVLPDVLTSISEPCVFWLDGHYSGPGTARGTCDYPLIGELEAIKHYSVREHVILIDDARLFVGEAGAPALGQILEHLRQINPRYVVKVKDDVIRAYVPRSWCCRPHD